jgi:hypothetical protein
MNKFMFFEIYIFVQLFSVFLQMKSLHEKIK